VIHGKTGENYGEIPLEQALSLADSYELDLVEISPQAEIPVCKIMDLGQFLYQKKKTDQKNKKNQKQTEIKGIRIGFRIGEHDFEVRQKQARKFFEQGNNVRVVMIFKGREMSYMALGLEKIEKFAAMLSDVSTIDTPPKTQGHQLVMILSPKR
jgi:translation initiation factor IF-3